MSEAAHRLTGRQLWAASGALVVVLFGCGLLFADILATANYPPLDASSTDVRRYALDNRNELHAIAFFHSLAAVALMCFAAYLSGRIRVARPGGT